MPRKLHKAKVLQILNSDTSAILLAKELRVSNKTINNIRAGYIYEDIFKEYMLTIASQKKRQDFIPDTQRMESFFYSKNIVEEYSVLFSCKDMLITTDLRTQLTTISFNTTIEGDSITYEEYLQKLITHNILK